jgi:hypothetical protein
MDWDHFNHFVDPAALQDDGIVQPQDLAWDPRPGALGGQDDFSTFGLPDTSQDLQGLPTLDSRGKVPAVSSSRAPIRSLESRALNAALPKPTPRNLPQGAATAPNLPRTRALAKSKLISNHLGLRRDVHPTPTTQSRTTSLNPTLLHHVNALQARVHALENHVEVLTKSLRTWDPETWECLREMVQELCEGNAQPEGGT